MRIVLTTLSMFINLTSYHICSYFYKNDIDKWYDFKFILTSFSFILLYQSLFYSSTKLSRFLATIYYGIFIEDFTDRVFFNTTCYEWNDILTLLLIIAIAIHNYKNEKW